MSEIYVKWNSLSKHADQLNDSVRWVREYSSRVESVRDKLRLSDSVSAQIKARLSHDAEKLSELSDKLQQLSGALGEAAVLYKNTEHSMMDK